MAVPSQGSMLTSLGLSFLLPKARILVWPPGEGRVSGEEVPSVRALLSPVEVPLMWAMPVPPGKIGITSQAERGPGATEGTVHGAFRGCPGCGERAAWGDPAGSALSSSLQPPVAHAVGSSDGAAVVWRSQGETLPVRPQAGAPSHRFSAMSPQFQREVVKTSGDRGGAARLPRSDER